MSYLCKLFLVGVLIAFCAISCKDEDKDPPKEASVTLSAVEQVNLNSIELTGSFYPGDMEVDAYGFQLSLESDFSTILKSLEYTGLTDYKNTTETVVLESSKENTIVYARGFVSVDNETIYSNVANTNYINSEWILIADTLSKGVAYSLIGQSSFVPDQGDVSVTIGDINLNIDSISNSNFYFSIPDDFPVGQNMTISLSANNIDQELSKNEVYISRWKFVPDDFYDLYVRSQGFKLGDYAYFFGRSSGDVGKALKFNFSTGEWTDISSSFDQSIINRENGVGESVMGIGFLGVGEVNLEKANDCYLFNDSNILFEKIDSLPQPGTSYPLSFALNNSIYVLNAHIVYQLDLSQPLSWNQLNDAPGNFNFDVAVEHEGLAYCTNAGILWKYDPNSDVWQEESSFPDNFFPVRGVGFAINNKIYYGLAQFDTMNRMYSYDLNTGEWEQEERLHLSGTYINGALAFIHANKAYIFHEVNNGYFIYDPN
ncbi:hypothetical protein C900_00275 [Fulvivirga imtechensis AK7]|uniref:Uncharacterized protein n=1 Tax=Fulvivirga imtechensis AK7 TaxID=1237149 RepID=L8JLX8_9BACT|nr:hypothetical protein [Fulvivirga imtechensis]ELR68534.1 hypothetical protein C900_00275 [Fulvivirga imtechensis AK7]